MGCFIDPNRDVFLSFSQFYGHVGVHGQLRKRSQRGRGALDEMLDGRGCSPTQALAFTVVKPGLSCCSTTLMTYDTCNSISAPNRAVVSRLKGTITSGQCWDEGQKLDSFL